MNRHLVVGAALVAALAAGFGALRPPDWGLSPEAAIAAERRGRQVFLVNCATCHRGESGIPGQDELRADYSSREIAAALATPPPGMPPFGGTDAEQRDLLIFLSGG